MLRASKRTGFVICLTEMRLTCSEVRKPKDMLVTSVGTGCAGLAMAREHKLKLDGAALLELLWLFPRPNQGLILLLSAALLLSEDVGLFEICVERRQHRVRTAEAKAMVASSCTNASRN